MKWLLFLFLLLCFSFVVCVRFLYPFDPQNVQHGAVIPAKTKSLSKDVLFLQLKAKAALAKEFILRNGYSTRFVFLLDMHRPSGQKRFFIFDLQKDSIVASGLVAHGSCNNRFLETPTFSNTSGCGCSAVGKYKIGEAYTGRFGKAFKLYGLDSSNSNAYLRNIVLHAYSCVPDEECHPYSICNSLGCAMVSYKFLNTAASVIEKEKKPLLLWMYE